jgi:hypothetical protein
MASDFVEVLLLLLYVRVLISKIMVVYLEDLVSFLLATPSRILSPSRRLWLLNLLDRCLLEFSLAGRKYESIKDISVGEFGYERYEVKLVKCKEGIMKDAI